MPFRYPVALEIEGRPCVVIGGGMVAEHKARSLIEAEAQVTVIAPEFTDGLRSLAGRGRMALIERSYSRGDLQGAFLAIAATDDPAINSEIFDEAEAERVLLNAVDDNPHCHFAVPSIVRRGDFLMTISTGGKAPALSKRLRMELSSRFGDEYGALVDVLGEVRAEALAERKVDFETWARRWQDALDGDLLSLVRRGELDEARRVIREALDGVGRRAGGVSIVGAGPGDPGLITVRGRDVLEAADVVVYDRLVHPSLVKGRNGICVGKAPGRHTWEQEEINSLLIRLARVGKSVVRLKGGDPFVFGRGGEEAEALAHAGVEFEVVPAPTSAIAALAYAGIPVTDRRYSSSVAIVTGHCAREEIDFRSLATSVDTIVVLMGLAQLPRICRELIEGGRDPATPAAIVENGTLPSQRVIVSGLAGLASAAREARVTSPAAVVIGEVVRLRKSIGWFGPIEEGGIEDVSGVGGGRLELARR